MRHYRNLIVSAEIEVIIATNYWEPSYSSSLSVPIFSVLDVKKLTILSECTMVLLNYQTDTKENPRSPSWNLFMTVEILSNWSRITREYLLKIGRQWDSPKRRRYRISNSRWWLVLDTVLCLPGFVLILFFLLRITTGLSWVLSTRSTW